MYYENAKTNPQRKTSSGAEVPPNLFEDKKDSAVPRKKWIMLLIALAVVISAILCFPYNLTIHTTGKTVPQQIWSVDAPFSGMIVETAAKKGNVVQKGARLLLIESEALSAQIRTFAQEEDIWNAKIKMLEENIREVKETADRKRIYYEVGAISLNEKRNWEDKLQGLEGERGILTREKEKIQVKREELQGLSSKGILSSPGDGIIFSEIRNNPGARVAEGNSLLEIASHGCNFDIAVREEDARLIELGAKAEIRLANAPFKLYQGQVIRKEAKVEEEIDRVWYKTHKVHILIEPLSEIQLVPGMQAEVRIAVPHKTNILQKLVTRTFLN